MAKDSSPPTEFEPLDSELLPRQVEAPPHFEADEWKALTGVISVYLYHSYP
jgi:hypothetical protein